MAARQVRRRLFSLFTTRQPHPSVRTIEPSWKLLSSATSYFSRDELSKRGLQTLSKPTEQAVKELAVDEACSLKSDSNSPEVVPIPINKENSAVNFSATSNLKVSPRHDLAMIYTCKVCETRSIKTVCRESYEKGVVVARCDGCNNLHLIADRLGWFGEPGSIEELLAARGEEVKKGYVDTLNLALEDLAGKKNLEI
ncbi:unnamed protein product [Ilex paraguariensis]|uniref:DNL-type domain-containing protein n=1 Tax=Ilex paraguariensis TaxID=185542 RepID=A0ABC8SR53_9AQUA